MILIIANFCFCNAQTVPDIIQIKGAEGSAYIYGDVSENQAREKALEEAKIDALKKAHIAEQIGSYEQLYSCQTNNKFSQFFDSNVQSEIRGSILSYTIVSEGQKIDKDIDKIEYAIMIDAEVIKYKTAADYTFTAEVDKILPVYKNEDKLTFSLKTSQDCYLTIFNITDHDASLMFPNIIEKEQDIGKEKEYNFPLKSNIIDYVLETDKENEINRLIFVFTKTRIPYLSAEGDGQTTSREKIMTWIYTIPPDQRILIYRQFHIVRDNR
ncbi:MAG: DUF4384 domain-containing protein [Bacteroidales bacterium]|nr:DUF4384 domain-containing protein [Bacteroidales bacterium]MCI1785175.1 DUF4384 domain-containing protein [Bacteroidales bacterium]